MTPVTDAEAEEIRRWAESHEHNDESTTVAATYLRLLADRERMMRQIQVLGKANEARRQQLLEEMGGRARAERAEAQVARLRDLIVRWHVLGKTIPNGDIDALLAESAWLDDAAKAEGA